MMLANKNDLLKSLKFSWMFISLSWSPLDSIAMAHGMSRLSQMNGPDWPAHYKDRSF